MIKTITLNNNTPVETLTLEAVAKQLNRDINLVSKAVREQRVPLLSSGEGRARRYFLVPDDVPRIRAAVEAYDARVAESARRKGKVAKVEARAVGEQIARIEAKIDNILSLLSPLTK